MKRSNAPVWVGFGTALVVVLVAGNQWATEELLERINDSPWLRGFIEAQWRLTTDGRPFDVYLVTNSFIAVYLIALLVLLGLTLRKVDSPLVALIAAWGASSAAGLLGGLVRGGLAEITDNPFFTRAFESSPLESLTVSVERAAPFVIWTGLLVGIAAAIATAVTSSPSANAPAFVPPMAGAGQPPPPVGAPAAASAPAPSPAPAGDPPPPVPSTDPIQGPPPGSF